MRELSLAKLFDISKIVINFASIESSDQLSTNRQIQTDEYNRSMLQFLEIYIKKNRLFCPLRRKSIRVDERRKKFQYGLKLDVVGRRRFWVTFQRWPLYFKKHRPGASFSNQPNRLVLHERCKKAAIRQKTRCVQTKEISKQPRVRRGKPLEEE